MPEGERHPHVVGSGPGHVTADGCPVTLWATLPAGDIPALLRGVIPAAATVLDLGAGAGRLANPLAAAGHRVTAVDESVDMLVHVRGAETIEARIEDLRLGREFGAVLLASHLVNVPDEVMRARLLATCRAHVAPGGVVILQRYTPAWAETATGQTDFGAGITWDVVVRPVPSAGRPHVRVTSTYSLGDSQWEQRYVSCLLDDRRLQPGRPDAVAPPER